MKPQKYNLPIPWNRHYAKHKHKAYSKGHEWAFTHESWYKIWQDSGVMQYRGRRVHEYCMVRLDPIEAWGPHNCIIVERRKQMSSIITKNPHTKQKRHRPLEFSDDVTPKHKINRSFE